MIPLELRLHDGPPIPAVSATPSPKEVADLAGFRESPAGSSPGIHWFQPLQPLEIKRDEAVPSAASTGAQNGWSDSVRRIHWFRSLQPLTVEIERGESIADSSGSQNRATGFGCRNQWFRH